ncbi:hypothetical protein YC2023_060168 [Brassica napus]
MAHDWWDWWDLWNQTESGGRDLLGVDQGDGFGSVHLDKEVLKRDVSKDLPRRFGYQGVVGTIWRWFVRRSVIQILILCLNRISISQMGYKGHHVQRSGLGRIRYWLELVLIPGEKLFVCLDDGFKWRKIVFQMEKKENANHRENAWARCR